VSPVTRAVVSFGFTAAFLAAAIFLYGGPGVFFSYGPQRALAVLTVAAAVAAYFAGGNVSPGVREDRANRWVIPVFGWLGALVVVLPVVHDRGHVLPIDGLALRWAGVAIFAIGLALRLWPVYLLGNRFSGLVAIQEGHTLLTTGIYSIIRHPSYLGLLLSCLGWALAFNSIAGVVLTVLMLVPVVARIRAEEALLANQFGAEYEAYRARTSRLLPGIY